MSLLSDNMLQGPDFDYDNSQRPSVFKNRQVFSQESQLHYNMTSKDHVGE